MYKILMIIDMQMIPFVWKEYGGKSIYEEENLLNNAKLLIEKARNEGIPIYYILHTEGDGSPRAEGEPLWQVHPDLAPHDGDRRIIKYHADSFLKTEMDSLLKKDRAGTVVVCGLQTEFCVDTTVKSAFSHGYHVILAKDCHSTFDSDLLPAEKIIDHHNLILELFADIVPVNEINF